MLRPPTIGAAMRLVTSEPVPHMMGKRPAISDADLCDAIAELNQGKGDNLGGSETRTAKSSAMASILSAAQGLHQSGVIDKATMRDYEALRLTSVPDYTSADVVRVRNKTRVSQNLFARRLNVSPSTVHQWESGQKRPSKLAAKLLSVVEKHGISVLD